MTRNQNVTDRAHSINIRAWKYGQLPMPDWVPQHIAGGIEPNGTSLRYDVPYDAVSCAASRTSIGLEARS